ncbi:hypothetical protein PQX77_014704 [Marasmius sp. AFHP31]|nr:hypothetical protein PQX77_014704 [Marasmius sp. AFHP31]
MQEDLNHLTDSLTDVPLVATLFVRHLSHLAQEVPTMEDLTEIEDLPGLRPNPRLWGGIKTPFGSDTTMDGRVPSRTFYPVFFVDDLPTTEKAWEAVMKRVDGIDNGMDKGWKEDIDTLLVFAGLFSAVVTAFTIESYQWLSEDPADQTVALLAQISTQINGGNITVVHPPQFTPSPSVVRINTFWFLSLLLSLVDALLGLMFKQWLREYRRATHTKTPEQWLSLRCFRNECFERWHVPSFLATLPIILEMALFCFFAGLLELLWLCHRVPFTIASIVTGTALAFYVATTILPGIDIILLALRTHPMLRMLPGWEAINYLPEIHYTCPYKSPQAWAIFRLLVSIFGPSSPLFRPVTSHLVRRRFFSDRPEVPLDAVGRLSIKLDRAISWSLLDLGVIQTFFGLSDLRGTEGWMLIIDPDDFRRLNGISEYPDMYKMQAYRWLVREFRDIPSMRPYLQTLLRSLPPDLVMTTVYDLDIVRLDRDYNLEDVDRSLDIFLPRPKPLRQSPTYLRLLFFHHSWIRSPEIVNCFIPPGAWDDRHHLVNPREFQAPITRLFNLILTGDSLRTNYAFLFIRNILKTEKELYGDVLHLENVPISTYLPMLSNMDLSFVEDKQPLFDLLVLLNSKLIKGNHFKSQDPLIAPNFTMYDWIDGLDIFRVSFGLPKGYFERHPGGFPVSLDRVSVLLYDLMTKELGLGYLEDFRRACEDEAQELNQWFLFRYLQAYLFDRIPTAFYPPNVWEEINDILPDTLTPLPIVSGDTVPFILASEEGLAFFRYFNTTVSWVYYGRVWTESWKRNLQCLAHLNCLSPDYFSLNLDGSPSLHSENKGETATSRSSGNLDTGNAQVEDMSSPNGPIASGEGASAEEEASTEPQRDRMGGNISTTER